MKITVFLCVVILSALCRANPLKERPLPVSVYDYYEFVEIPKTPRSSSSVQRSISTARRDDQLTSSSIRSSKNEFRPSAPFKQRPVARPSPSIRFPQHEEKRQTSSEIDRSDSFYKQKRYPQKSIPKSKYKETPVVIQTGKKYYQIEDPVYVERETNQNRENEDRYQHTNSYIKKEKKLPIQYEELDMTHDLYQNRDINPSEAELLSHYQKNRHSVRPAVNKKTIYQTEAPREKNQYYQQTEKPVTYRQSQSSREDSQYYHQTGDPNPFKQNTWQSQDRPVMQRPNTHRSDQEFVQQDYIPSEQIRNKFQSQMKSQSQNRPKENYDETSDRSINNYQDRDQGNVYDEYDDYDQYDEYIYYDDNNEVKAYEKDRLRKEEPKPKYRDTEKETRIHRRPNIDNSQVKESVKEKRDAFVDGSLDANGKQFISDAAAVEHDKGPGRLSFQIHGQKGPHSYRFGYDTGKGHNRLFRYEERDNYGRVYGRYGFYDEHGKLQVVNYKADPKKGFSADVPHH